jgi:hypothetical protein
VLTRFHQNHIFHLDGREDAGQRHGSAHGDGQRSFGKYDGIAADKIGGHASKWSGQLIEV